MKYNLILLSFLLLFSSCLANTKVELMEIYDGDTIRAKINKEEFSLRLIGVDCFETSAINRAYKQAYENDLKIEDIIKQGKYAKKYVENLYKKSSKNVHFDFYGIDKYSRILAVLYFDNLNINQELINKNICKNYKYF